MRFRRKALVAFFAIAVTLPAVGAGCSHSEGDTVNVAPGVLFRRDRESAVAVLDIDLTAAKVRPVVVMGHVERVRNNFVGDAHTVLEWAQAYNAVGGVNAGFFGDTYDDLGRRKQIVGLAVRDGKVFAPGDLVPSDRHPGETFLRSAIGFRSDGTPDIAWASGTLSGPLRRYASAVSPRAASPWNVRYAVACGPRLFSAGARHIADKEERLVSPGKVPRTFVAYDRDGDHPRHLVFGRADAMEFTDVAVWLTDYFARAHESTPREAMCLDGGPSSQIVYRDGENGGLIDAEPTGTFVPTAILLVPKD